MSGDGSETDTVPLELVEKDLNNSNCYSRLTNQCLAGYIIYFDN